MSLITQGGVGMAYVERFIGSVTSGDQTGQHRSVSVRIAPAKARLWFAAADHAARLATDAGLLLLSLNDVQASDGQPGLFSFNIDYQDQNDAYAKPAIDSGIFNSNMVRVTVQTTNGGLPALDEIYIPQRKDSALTLQSDGKAYDLTQSPFPNMATQLASSGLSKFNTPILSIVEAVPNDV